MSPQELVSLAKAGDQEAFRELHRQHANYVARVARLVLRRHDVEDLCQNVFLLAFTRLDGFDGRCAFRTWITRITVNQALVELRTYSQGKNGRDHLADVDLAMLPGLEDRQLCSASARLDAERLLGSLKPVDRRVLELTYLEGCRPSEIAKAFGISVDGARSKIWQAKSRARAQCRRKRAA